MTVLQYKEDTFGDLFSIKRFCIKNEQATRMGVACFLLSSNESGQILF